MKWRKRKKKTNKKNEHTMFTHKTKSLCRGHQGRWNIITTHVTLLYYPTHLNEEPLGVATP